MMNRTRPKQIVIRLSEEEYEQVKRKVAESGLKQQDYLSKAILDKSIINTDGLKEVVLEAKHQGNNLNQIAAKLNANGYVDYKGLGKTMDEVRSVWQSLSQYLQKLV